MFADALSALEQRIKIYNEKHEAAISAVGLSLPKTQKEYTKTTTTLLLSNKKRALLDYCFRVRKAALKFPDADDSYGSLSEMNGFYIVTQLKILGRLTEAVKEGEDYIRKYPSSPYYDQIEMQVRQAVKTSQDQQEQTAKIEATIEEIDNNKSVSPETIIFQKAEAWVQGKFWRNALSLFLKLDFYNPGVSAKGGIKHIPGDVILNEAFSAANALLVDDSQKEDPVIDTDREIALRLATILDEAYPTSTYRSGIHAMITSMAQIYQ
jgi:hypothetical protein